MSIVSAFYFFVCENIVERLGLGGVQLEFAKFIQPDHTFYSFICVHQELCAISGAGADATQRQRRQVCIAIDTEVLVLVVFVPASTTPARS